MPLLDGEWEFIAISTPDAADSTKSQRERVTASLLRCPDDHDDTNAQR